MTALLLSACSTEKNPFFEAYNTPYQIPPFEKIKTEHYLPAFIEGIAQQQAEVDAIAANTEAPTFANTIEALDYSGELLTKVSSVFYTLYSSDTNPEMDIIAETVSPLLSEHSDNTYLNKALFERVKTLFENKELLNLTKEQDRVLEKYYKGFVRSGAGLNDAQQDRLREINKELGLLELSFGRNVLAETNSYKKYIENENDLAGLPQSVRQAAYEAAKKEGQEGKWLFTTHKASFIPVLQYGENRELRKELLLAYSNLADNNNENDNKANINNIMKLRVEKAQLLGYNSPAEFILEPTMAKTPATVTDFLSELWTPALAKAKEEAQDLQKMMDQDVSGQKLEAWDWWYYAEKLRVEKYDLDEETVRSYFKMENVRQGAFDLATNLFGLKFKKITNVPLYHHEAETFEVLDADDSLIGVLYTDYFPRASKRSGAWMTSFFKQHKKDGVNYRPVIVNVGNFTAPTSDKPSLLSMDEVETLFHEFGHALHGLLSQCTYPSVSGTSVPRDFVELPSQVMENWCFEPEVLKTYAFHYETGAVIPNELIEKIQNAATFNQGFAWTEFLSAALLDMDYHNLSEVKDINVTAFENASLENMGLIPEIIVRYRSTYFNHIFRGGYSAGYYSYKWSEVLDADAFQAFKETGDLYNQKVALSFRKNILEKGGSEDPMKLYIDFRGAAPSTEPLLRKIGLK
jgi:Zn-dependent oligopeptidases